MCGICGLLANGSMPIDTNEIIRMRDVMIHRGPDDAGIFIGEGIGLGHRRLCIIDLDKGQQPMFNEDRTITVVYNGEIYNYFELKKSLEKKGHIFSTNSDTEVILHLYEEAGVDLVTKLKGMFAFAIWDCKKRILLLARDKLGIKPLYFSRYRGKFIFASEIKAILESNSFEREINLEVLPDFLRYGYVFGEKTLFRNIFKLLPGHILIIKDGKINIKKYWDLSIPRDVEEQEEQHHRKLNFLLQKSVKMHLMSDVPLGVFLSGGIDSSAIVYYMSQLNQQKVNTFSVGFNQSFNELQYAKLIADRFQTNHRTLTLSEENFLKIFSKTVESSIPPTLVHLTSFNDLPTELEKQTLHKNSMT